jgi:hypothetical protein
MLAVAAIAAFTAQASSTASALEPRSLVRAQTIRVQLDARYRVLPRRGLRDAQRVTLLAGSVVASRPRSASDEERDSGRVSRAARRSNALSSWRRVMTARRRVIVPSESLAVRLSQEGPTRPPACHVGGRGSPLHGTDHAERLREWPWRRSALLVRKQPPRQAGFSQPRLRLSRCASCGGAVQNAGLESSLWDTSGTHVAMTANKNPRFTGVLEADEGTRTLDLLHGKCARCSDLFARVRSKPLVCRTLVRASERERTRTSAQPCHSCHGSRRRPAHRTFAGGARAGSLALSMRPPGALTSGVGSRRQPRRPPRSRGSRHLSDGRRHAST